MAVLALNPVSASPVLGVTAPHGGESRPQHSRRRPVRAGAPLGVVDSRGRWRAVGTISDAEARRIHVGDAAHVTGPGRWRRYAGTVESVRGPSLQPPYDAQVGVRFLTGAAALDVVRPRTIEVTPQHPQDSLPSVPAAAAFALPGGTAILVREDPSVFRVAWVTMVGRSGAAAVLEAGPPVGATVVTGGAEALLATARESLAVRPSP